MGLGFSNISFVEDFVLYVDAWFFSVVSDIVVDI